MIFKNSLVSFLIFSFTLISVNLFANEKTSWISIFEDFLFSNLKEKSKEVSKIENQDNGFKKLVYKHKDSLIKEFENDQSFLFELEKVKKVFARIFYTDANFLYNNEINRFFKQIDHFNGIIDGTALNPQGINNFSNYTSIYTTAYHINGKSYAVQYSLVKNGNDVNIKKTTNNNGDIYQTKFHYVLDKSLEADEFFNNKKFYSKKYIII